MEAMFMKQFGEETHIKCDDDCQYANISREIKDGRIDHIYEEDIAEDVEESIEEDVKKLEEEMD